MGGPVVGATVDVECGDVVLIPPGVAHKSITSSEDFVVLGTYPKVFLSKVN
jgi:uncharacterized protein YjlB